MLYIPRFAEELRESKSASSGIPDVSISSQELSLAKQLINGSTSQFDLSAYHDEYEAAVRKLVDAKRKGKPLPEPEAEPARPKVVNIMDALRRSLETAKSPARKTSRRKKAA